MTRSTLQAAADLSTVETIVPRSGTGDLTGITGRATEAAQGVLTLEYDI